MPWRLAQARLTCFFSGAIDLADNNWWITTLGVPPDESITRRAEGIRSDSSVIDGNRIALTLQNKKVDWVISPEQTVFDEEFRTIGTYEEGMNFLRNNFINWLSTSGEITRIAVGSHSISDVEDRQSGYEFLNQKLKHLTIVPESSTDLLYQINRPIPHRFDGTDIEVNRVMKWTVAKFEAFAQLVGPVADVPRRIARSFHAKCELDVNTSQALQGTIHADIRPAIFEQLVEYGREILEEGEPE